MISSLLPICLFVCYFLRTCLFLFRFATKLHTELPYRGEPHLGHHWEQLNYQIHVCAVVSKGGDTLAGNQNYDIWTSRLTAARSASELIPNILAEVPGLEPRMWESKSQVLPITPNLYIMRLATPDQGQFWIANLLMETQVKVYIASPFMLYGAGVEI